MLDLSKNCAICSTEIVSTDTTNKALLRANIGKYKICNDCFNSSNPEEDYKQVREILASYYVDETIIIEE